MLTAKLDLQAFFRRSDAVALLVPAADVFGFLRRTLDLPEAWAALVTRDSGEIDAVSGGGRLKSDGASQVLFARTAPVDVVIKQDGLVTQDEFQVTADLRFRLALLGERSELLSFQRAVLGGQRVATIATLVQYLQPAVHRTVSTLAVDRKVAELIGAEGSAAAENEVRTSLHSLCFSGGLAMDGPIAVRFESAAYRAALKEKEDSARRRQVHVAARQVQEVVEKAQNRHLDHLGSLLTRLAELTRSSPGVSQAELIRTFSEQQRGEIYEALLAAQTPAKRTRWLVVAAGDELLFFDPQGVMSPSRRLTITSAVGSIRSVQSSTDSQGRAVLWLGAATGIYRLPLDRTEPDLVLDCGDGHSVRGGFNSVAVTGSLVLASHSELGIWEWVLDPKVATTFGSKQKITGRARFESATQGAKAVRNIMVLSDEIYCAVDNRVLHWHSDDPSEEPASAFVGSQSTIASICPTPLGLLAGNSDGDILYWTQGGPSDPERLSSGQRRAAESVWVLSAQGVDRVVYSDTSIHVHARVLSDSFTCHYEAGGQTLRRVEVTDDLLAATTELRDRLILWTPSQSARPIAVIPVSALCGRTIQDVCLVANPSPQEAPSDESTQL